jgi:radical SAM superfamily enzyme YgiQ (UPF0313 family)
MKILLAGINAKYVQTNLAIRLLKSFVSVHSASVRQGRVTVELSEWNINQSIASIVRGIFQAEPTVILFSTYIWNRDMTFRVAEELKKVLPSGKIGFGGPEVSWSPDKTFTDCSAADFVIAGEGELTFAEMTERLAVQAEMPSDFYLALEDLSGLYVRSFDDGEICSFGGVRPPVQNLDIVPFPYDREPLDFDPENRIVYYESSRGCPFSCAYCLSSIEKAVRYYPLDRVLREISFFMDNGFPLVKFVDRTFNLDPKRYLLIWSHIRDYYNNKTLFHFEIAAEYLEDEALRTLESMPDGSIQLEIGIQSINNETLSIVGRPAHPEVLAEKIRRIPEKIHTHVDLIAGLPAENLESFARSFDFAFALDADMLQVGFLKILAGTKMERIAYETKGYVWSSHPPYEVYASSVLSFKELLIIKDVEHLVDTWYNSGLMRHTVFFLAKNDPEVSPFPLFRSLANFVRIYYQDADLYLPRRTADSFACMASFLGSLAKDKKTLASAGLEYLRYDFLLQGKPGAFPGWYERRYSKEVHDRALEQNGFLGNAGNLRANPVSRRERYSRTELDSFDFGQDGKEVVILFVYPGIQEKNRKVTCVTLE